MDLPSHKEAQALINAAQKAASLTTQKQKVLLAANKEKAKMILTAVRLEMAGRDSYLDTRNGNSR